MFNLKGDRVYHRQTGEMGVIIGYGDRLISNSHFTTVKILLTQARASQPIVEDLLSEWRFH